MFKPVGKRLLVEEIADNTTQSGIILATKQTEKPIKGTIIEVSDEIAELKVGTVVFYSKYAGVNTEIDDKPYIVLQEGDILGYLN